MKLKLYSVILVVVAATFIACAAEYLASLNARTRSLEARLALLEKAVNGEKIAAATGTQRGTTVFPVIPQPSTDFYAEDPLEGRVENPEQQLTPYLEPIPLAR